MGELLGTKSFRTCKHMIMTASWTGRLINPHLITDLWANVCSDILLVWSHVVSVQLCNESVYSSRILRVSFGDPLRLRKNNLK